MWSYDQQQLRHSFAMSSSNGNSCSRIGEAYGTAGIPVVAPSQPRLCKSAPCSPLKPLQPQQHPLKKLSSRADSFHVIHKVPAGDTPYVKAKHVQLVDKDPDRAIALFWAAINAGDRVDSALKDMAIVMKQQNRAEEAIEAIKSLRCRCSENAQESIDNVLLDLYKRCGRLDDQIALLKHKLHLIHLGLAFNGRRTKTARCQGKKFQVSIEQEATRLLGNLGWAYMQQSNFVAAEAVYWKALSIEADSNKICNLGICLMKLGWVNEAKTLLQNVKPAIADSPWGQDSHLKSYERAQQMLKELAGADDKEKEALTAAAEVPQTEASSVVEDIFYVPLHETAPPAEIVGETGVFGPWRSCDRFNPLIDSDLSGALLATAGFGPSLQQSSLHAPAALPSQHVTRHRRANSYASAPRPRWEETNDALQGFADENSSITSFPSSSSFDPEALRHALEAMALACRNNNNILNATAFPPLVSSSHLSSAARPFVSKSAFSSPARSKSSLPSPAAAAHPPLPPSPADWKKKQHTASSITIISAEATNNEDLQKLHHVSNKKAVKSLFSGEDEWSRLGFIQSECSSPLCTIANIEAKRAALNSTNSPPQPLRRLQVFQEMTTGAC